MYCQLALKEATLAFDKLYTYEIPEALASLVEVGSLVEIPFGTGNTKRLAYVINFLDDYDSTFALKKIEKVLSAQALVHPDQIKLAQFMKKRYICTLGQALNVMIPAAIIKKTSRTSRACSLLDAEDALERLSAGEIRSQGHVRVLEFLLDYGTALTQEIQQVCQVSAAVLKLLEKKKLIYFFKQITGAQVVEPKKEVGIGQAAAVKEVQTTTAQTEAIRTIMESFHSEQEMKQKEILLFGVTGSGKTEVYLQVASQVLNAGKGVIILVPEISLTPQMIERVQMRFGDILAVIHSRMTPAERHQAWQRIWDGQAKIVVGARSAIFAPLADIGLIIIDEEQESSYKSETAPRYHAFEIARLRRWQHQAVLVLGSATPSIETYYKTENEQMQRVELPERINKMPLPETILIDMKEALVFGKQPVFSQALKHAMEKAFQQGEQVMIFLNRRGHASLVLCQTCGHIANCTHCSVSLTLHNNPYDKQGLQKQHLICHYCGRIYPLPKKCPQCHKETIGYYGLGTEQVEEVFKELFPKIQVIRMDMDTTLGRDAHHKLLAEFTAEKAQALIGTQMIAKGHDFAKVTVVGILAADLLLGQADYRAAERAFQLITQAAGRAGRDTLPGRVLIQAFNVDHFALRYGAKQDYLSFYKEELYYRQKMQMPPFKVIAQVLLSGTYDYAVRKKTEQVSSAMQKRINENGEAFGEITISKYAKAPLWKIKGYYRYRIIIKGDSTNKLTEFLSFIATQFHDPKIFLQIDINPWHLA